MLKLVIIFEIKSKLSVNRRTCVLGFKHIAGRYCYRVEVA